KLRAIGVTGPKRSPLMPDVPTIAEAGLPDYAFETWFMVFAPAGTPQPVIEKLSAALQKSVTDPGFRAKMAELGAEAV
ncbi:tripartite tricarboxylate transporter substrate-binding protein, partial [Acinetobacter baumannii]